MHFRWLLVQKKSEKRMCTFPYKTIINDFVVLWFAHACCCISNCRLKIYNEELSVLKCNLLSYNVLWKITYFIIFFVKSAIILGPSRRFLNIKILLQSALISSTLKHLKKCSVWLKYLILSNKINIFFSPCLAHCNQKQFYKTLT